MPCAAAVSASSRWVKVGVVMITASNATLSSASSSEANRASMANSSPVAAKVSATGSTSATIFRARNARERPRMVLADAPRADHADANWCLFHWFLHRRQSDTGRFFTFQMSVFKTSCRGGFLPVNE